MNVIGHLSAEAAGDVRRCEPYRKLSPCPGCGFTHGGLIRKPAKTVSLDDTFVQRTCRKCGTQWREFHTEETMKGS